MSGDTVNGGASGASTLAARLDAARARSFVGRVGEVELFRQAITADQLPFAVLYLHGPGGVGKSALVDRFRREAERCSVPFDMINGRDFDATPDALLSTLGASVALRREGRRVLVIDTYEAIADGVESWLRGTFLPSLPAETLVVLAGRDAPSNGWREDPGWQELLRPISLRNLREEETAALLAQRAVPGEQHTAIHALTHGHPLAVALLIDMFAAGDLAGGEELRSLPPSVVHALLERLVRDVSDDGRRSALELSAHVRSVTAGLLRALHGDDRGDELFDWLRGLSFISETSDGLVVHDLVREIVDEDLKWRDLDRYREMHRRVRAHYLDRFWQSPESERAKVFRDILHLHRRNPLFRPFYTWSRHGLRGEPAGEDDREPILEIIGRHEGAASAAIAGYWLDRLPGAFEVFRDAEGTIHGLKTELLLDSVREDDLATDPVLDAVWQHLQRTAPLRPGETMSIGRFWMDREAYQAVTPVYELISVTSGVRWLTSPRLAWSMVLVEDPEFWGPMFAYIDFAPVPGLAVRIGERTFGAFAHDWRAMPVDPWMELMGEREIDDELSVARMARPPGDQLVVLSEPDFEAAVRDILRHYHRPAQLAASPLLRSRVALEAAGGEEPSPATLLALVRDAARSLEGHPRDGRLFRALDATYFRPAPTQEAAAERLDLPFSTYRRHLAAGVAHVVAALWDRELHGVVDARLPA